MRIQKFKSRVTSSHPQQGFIPRATAFFLSSQIANIAPHNLPTVSIVPSAVLKRRLAAVLLLYLPSSLSSSSNLHLGEVGSAVHTWRLTHLFGSRILFYQTFSLLNRSTFVILIKFYVNRMCYSPFGAVINLNPQASSIKLQASIPTTPVQGNYVFCITTRSFLPSR